MAQGSMAEYLRLHGLDKPQPKAPAAPIALPPQPILGNLAAQMPIRGRPLPMMMGSLPPALIRQLIMEQLAQGR